MATDWASVSAGATHTCAIRVGKLYCWGRDQNEQLGDGAGQINVSSPKQITAATDWKTVSAGAIHTCAIRSTGKLYCWGGDDSGQLGNGPANGGTPSTSPQQITSATDWTSVDAGRQHTCAIRVGKLYCWGFDGDGRLGNGAGLASQQAPQQITAATDWKSVSAGSFHTCAIRSTGKLYCWGWDDTGEIGNGPASTAQVDAPQQITTATDWTRVSTGGEFTCALRSTGKLYCWGDNFHGQVGNGTDGGYVSAPTQSTTAADWKSVSANFQQSCAIRSTGKLYCWGDDSSEQLGNGAAGNADAPLQITSATDWTNASGGDAHSCAIRAGGKLYCWGRDDNGQLGNGSASMSTQNVPQQV